MNPQQPPFQPPAQWSGAPPPAQWAPLPPGQKPAKGKRIGLYIGCGCLSLFGIVASIAGCLVYQEEGRGIHVPDSAVETVPVSPGVPFVIRFKWEGTGYAFNNVWLVVDDGKKSGGDFKITGTLNCTSGSPDKIAVSLSDRYVHDKEDKGGDAFSAWFYLGDEYSHSSSRTLECSGTVEPVTGQWSKARIVVTQRQRPSDFFAR